MKFWVAIIVAVIASFVLSLAAEEIATYSLPPRVHNLYLQFPAVTLIIGAALGFIMRQKARSAAAYGLAPWGIWLFIGVAGHRLSWSQWTLTFLMVSIYFAMGVLAAGFIGNIMVRLSDRSAGKMTRRNPEKPGRPGDRRNVS